jgi:hypothetical protein
MCKKWGNECGRLLHSELKHEKIHQFHALKYETITMESKKI